MIAKWNKSKIANRGTIIKLVGIVPTWVWTRLWRLQFQRETMEYITVHVMFSAAKLQRKNRDLREKRRYFWNTHGANVKHIRNSRETQVKLIWHKRVSQKTKLSTQRTQEGHLNSVDVRNAWRDTCVKRSCVDDGNTRAHPLIQRSNSTSASALVDHPWDATRWSENRRAPELNPPFFFNIFRRIRPFFP